MIYYKINIPSFWDDQVLLWDVESGYNCVPVWKPHLKWNHAENGATF